MAGMYAWYAVLVHQTKFLIDIGVSAETAAFALGLVGLTGVASQIGIGMLSDRIGREWGWSIAYTGFTACYAIMLILPHYPALWLVYVMVVVQGLIGYGASAVYPTVPAELFHSPKYGQIFGIYGATSGFGAAVGPWATGELYDLTGGYETAFAVGAAAGFALDRRHVDGRAAQGPPRRRPGEEARRQAEGAGGGRGMTADANETPGGSSRRPLRPIGPPALLLRLDRRSGRLRNARRRL